MKKTVKSLDSLKNSRLLFDKQPPVFGYIFILLVAIFMCFALVWSIYTPKVYTIQAHTVLQIQILQLLTEWEE